MIKAQTIRIKEEIKFLHMKKHQLNRQLYHLHLRLANTWGNSRHYISDTIKTKLETLMKGKYRRLEQKLLNLSQNQVKTPAEHCTFYPRVINNTDITFSDNEITLLNKGFKYNLHQKKRQWLTDIALEAETTINSLPTADRPYYRKQVATCITQLHIHNNNKFSHKTHAEWSTMPTIKAKLRKNNAVVTSADKGNTLVILASAQYQEKLRDFTDNNNFQISNTDPTKTFQKHTRKVINISTNLINPDSRWKYTNLNPSAPTIRGLMKIHKREQPIRPIVNWRNAPAYKLAKLFAHKIQPLAPLPFTFNVKNTRHLIQELKQTPLTPTSRFASLDISNMYSNVPTKESRLILEDLLSHNTVDPKP